MPRKRRPGRPRTAKALRRSRGVTLWLTPREHAAVVARVERENATLVAHGVDSPAATVSSWFRDHGLDPLGLATYDGE